ncbi:hypothetical protein HYZ99_04435 [Candidatus Peregrinibacteria bacterium]|nr:hypothetical protein [Candidatus Peregrinibacteria bacterium]
MKVRAPRWLSVTAVILGSIAAGFFVSTYAPLVWDDPALHGHSQWLVWKFGLIDEAPMPSDNGKWTGPLWALVLGVATELIFPWLKDPYLVRHALTWALWPLTLIATYLLLQKCGIKKSTAFLAVAFLFGIIRFGGHALVSPRDFTHAAGFLLVTLALFVLLKNQKALARPGYLLLLGAISVIPFLLRPPDVLHVIILLFVLGEIAFGSKLQTQKKWRMPLIAIIGAAAFTIVISPVLWEQGFASLFHPFQIFSRFPVVIGQRAFGMAFRSDAVPLWYPFAVIPLISHPVVFLLTIPGLTAFLLLRSPEGGKKAKKGTLEITLKQWTLAIIVLSFAAILILRPHLYDEERHILFLYPLLFLAAALGFDRLRDHLKIGLALVIIAVSLISYGSWGRYAYAYKSPLIGSRNPDRFMGEYRAACLPEAVDALQGRVSANVPVVIFEHGPRSNAYIQEQRRSTSLIARTPHVEMHRFLEASLRRPYAALVHHGLNRFPEVVKDIEAGRAELLWKNTMPPGDIACVIALYR